MALCKRRRTGVDTFLDISAAEDRDEVEVEVEHDLDFEAEEPFEITDDEDNSDPTAYTQVSFEDAESKQSFLAALCDDLTARYVHQPRDNVPFFTNQSASGSSRTLLTVNPSLLSLSSESHLTPLPLFLPSPSPLPPSPHPHPPKTSATPSQSYSSMSQKRKSPEAAPTRNDTDAFYTWAPRLKLVDSVSGRSSTLRNDVDTLDIPQVHKLDVWERAHTLKKMADLANLPTVHPDDLDKEKKRYSRAPSTRLREYVGPNQWVTICSGVYRGDVGFTMGLPKRDQDEEDMENVSNNTRNPPAERWRHEQAQQLTQLQEEEREFIYLLGGGDSSPSNEFSSLQDDSLFRRDMFGVVLVPRLPPSKSEILEQRREPQDVVRPFAGDTDSRRYTPRLFKPEDYPGTVETWFDDVKYYRYKGMAFTPEGLLMTEYPRTSLRLATSIPPKLDKLFRQSCHEIVKLTSLPYPSNWSFDEGEEVIWTEPSCLGPALTHGWSTTFKHLQVIPRGHKPQTAIVLLNANVSSKKLHVVNPQPIIETPEERRLRENNERKRRQEEEAVSKGEFVAQVRHLLKPHQKDDWVVIMTGKHRGKSGRVLVRHEDIITVVLPEDHAMAVCHVNAAKRIPSLVEKTTYLSVFGERRELVPTPWLGTEVKATRGPHTGCVGRVELVERVNGRFGRKIMVGFWVELLRRLVFTDHDRLLTTGTAKRLEEAHPLTDMQSLIYGVSRLPLLTSREPWLDTRVAITKGQYKGYKGRVRGVNVTFETKNLKKDRHVEGKTVGRRRGIQLRIELETHVAGGMGLITVDYQYIRDAASGKVLNKAYPVRQGSFYDFRPDLEELPEIAEDLDRSEVPGTPQWSQEYNAALRCNSSVDTHWDPFAVTPLPLGTFGPDPSIPWTPESPSLNPTELPVAHPDDIFLDLPEQIHPEKLQEICLRAFRAAEAEATPAHWILHPKLVGLKVQAAVDGEDTYLDIIQGSSGLRAVKDVDGLRRTIADMTTVDHARSGIKPSTKKSLMVVIGGDAQHIGKLVRRVYNFYMGSKSEENHWINAVVIQRSSPTAVERMTSEELDLDPKTMLARVYESRKSRREANEYMKDTWKAALAGHKRVAPIRPLPVPAPSTPDES